MARPINKTSFIWDPDHESREVVWTRITAHIQEELDRIHADHVLARRIARRRAQPHYARNQELVQAARQGTPIAELARQYEISRQRVREIVCSEEFWNVENPWSTRRVTSCSRTVSPYAAISSDEIRAGCAGSMMTATRHWRS